MASPYRVVLTGFPVQNTLFEFFNMVKAVDKNAEIVKYENAAKQMAHTVEQFDALVLAVHKMSSQVMHRRSEELMLKELSNIKRTSFNTYIVMKKTREDISERAYDALLQLYKEKKPKQIVGKNA